jgi:hypothetical protein
MFLPAAACLKRQFWLLIVPKDRGRHTEFSLGKSIVLERWGLVEEGEKVECRVWNLDLLRVCVLLCLQRNP